MPVFTNCINCTELIVVAVAGSAGRFAPIDCSSCDTTNVVELIRDGGRTYRQDYFEASVLPTLDNVERIEHPECDAIVYGNPEVTKPASI